VLDDALCGRIAVTATILQFGNGIANARVALRVQHRRGFLFRWFDAISDCIQYLRKSITIVPQEGRDSGKLRQCRGQFHQSIILPLLEEHHQNSRPLLFPLMTLFPILYNLLHSFLLKFGWRNTGKLDMAATVVIVARCRFPSLSPCMHHHKVDSRRILKQCWSMLFPDHIFPSSAESPAHR
jgi:hypothetical protein